MMIALNSPKVLKSKFRMSALIHCGGVLFQGVDDSLLQLVMETSDDKDIEKVSIFLKTRGWKK